MNTNLCHINLNLTLIFSYGRRDYLMLSKDKTRMLVDGLALNIPLQSILLLAYRNVDNLSSIFFLTIVENVKNSSLTDFKVTLTSMQH